MQNNKTVKLKIVFVTESIDCKKKRIGYCSAKIPNNQPIDVNNLDQFVQRALDMTIILLRLESKKQGAQEKQKKKIKK